MQFDKSLVEAKVASLKEEIKAKAEKHNECVKTIEKASQEREAIRSDILLHEGALKAYESVLALLNETKEPEETKVAH